MRHLVCGMAVLVALLAISCSKKKDDTGPAPPGFCQTQAECQPEADRQNAYQDQLRQKLVAQGVHAEYLPCGRYESAKAPNGFWQITQDKAGCPDTASHQDPHPDPSKTKQSKQ